MLETFYETVEGLQAALDAYLIHYETERPHLGKRFCVSSGCRVRKQRQKSSWSSRMSLVVMPKLTISFRIGRMRPLIVDAGILRQRECRAWTLPNVQTLSKVSALSLAIHKTRPITQHSAMSDSGPHEQETCCPTLPMFARPGPFRSTRARLGTRSKPLAYPHSRRDAPRPLATAPAKSGRRARLSPERLHRRSRRVCRQLYRCAPPTPIRPPCPQSAESVVC